MLRCALASLIALALPFAPAQAQQAAPAEPLALDKLADPAITKAIEQGEIAVAPTGEIIVQGTTEKEIRNFVWRSITAMSGRKIAVRSAPVCIVFDNITAEFEEQLRQRIAENLAAIGTELAQPGCKVNAAVTFPRDAHAFMRWLNSNKRHMFGAMYEPERRRHALQRRLAYN